MLILQYYDKDTLNYQEMTDSADDTDGFEDENDYCILYSLYTIV